MGCPSPAETHSIVLRARYAPEDVYTARSSLRIVDTLREDRTHEESKLSAERTRLDSRLTVIWNLMDAAYADELDGKIPEDFRETHDERWRAEEQ